MTNRGVSIVVDEKFFNIFEKERKKEESKLKAKFGIPPHLTNKKFSGILAARNFRFEYNRECGKCY